jgi:hypothetical protein
MTTIAIVLKCMGNALSAWERQKCPNRAEICPTQSDSKSSATGG